jgi:hypothetical protein
MKSAAGIAWSVVWGTACVLLVAFWIVSRGQLDIVCYQTTAQKNAPAKFHVSTLPHTFDLIPSLGKVLVHIPIWALVAITAAMSTIPTLHLTYRFSLRTMLIATTLVAVVLGLVVWLSSA